MIAGFLFFSVYICICILYIIYLHISLFPCSLILFLSFSFVLIYGFGESELKDLFLVETCRVVGRVCPSLSSRHRLWPSLFKPSIDPWTPPRAVPPLLVGGGGGRSNPNPKPQPCKPNSTTTPATISSHSISPLEHFLPLSLSCPLICP